MLCSTSYWSSNWPSMEPDKPPCAGGALVYLLDSSVVFVVCGLPPESTLTTKAHAEMNPGTL